MSLFPKLYNLLCVISELLSRIIKHKSYYFYLSKKYNLPNKHPKESLQDPKKTTKA